MKKLTTKDVRVGNVVAMKCDGKMFNCQIEAGDYLDISRGYKEIMGIPISHEQLLKWGFLKSVYLQNLSRYKRDNLIWYTSGTLGVEGYGEIITLASNINCDHQLQNIWFSLKGEEIQ